MPLIFHFLSGKPMAMLKSHMETKDNRTARGGPQCTRGLGCAGGSRWPFDRTTLAVRATSAPGCTARVFSSPRCAAERKGGLALGEERRVDARARYISPRGAGIGGNASADGEQQRSADKERQSILPAGALGFYRVYIGWGARDCFVEPRKNFQSKWQHILFVK